MIRHIAFFSTAFFLLYYNPPSHMKAEDRIEGLHLKIPKYQPQHVTHSTYSWKFKLIIWSFVTWLQFCVPQE